MLKKVMILKEFKLFIIMFHFKQMNNPVLRYIILNESSDSSLERLTE